MFFQSSSIDIFSVYLSGLRALVQARQARKMNVSVAQPSKYKELYIWGQNGLALGAKNMNGFK